VTIIEVNPNRREALQQKFPDAIIKTDENFEETIQDADVIIGAVLIKGAKAPILITKDQIAKLKPGTIIIDVAIDQGGITEISHPTSILSPTYTYQDVVLDCVPNIPGAVPKTSTHLLTEATLPYVIELANKGLDVLKNNLSFQSALNIFKHACTNDSVAQATGVQFTDFQDLLE
jgi:alanine dehydrogenase